MNGRSHATQSCRVRLPRDVFCTPDGVTGRTANSTSSQTKRVLPSRPSRKEISSTHSMTLLDTTEAPIRSRVPAITLKPLHVWIALLCILALYVHNVERWHPTA